MLEPKTCRGSSGLGLSAERARKMSTEATRIGNSRDRLEHSVLSTVPGAERNGGAEPRVANTTNISFARIESESLLIGLDLEGLAVSSGSACSSARSSHRMCSERWDFLTRAR